MSWCKQLKYCVCGLRAPTQLNTLSSLLKNSRASVSTDEKENQNQLRLASVIFPALWASYMEFLRIWIGSLHCLYLMWLVEVITLVFVLRHSIKSRSKPITSKSLCNEDDSIKNATNVHRYSHDCENSLKQMCVNQWFFQRHRKLFVGL